MQTYTRSVTNWDGCEISVQLVEDELGEQPSMESLLEQFRCTLLGLGYAPKTIEEAL